MRIVIRDATAEDIKKVLASEWPQIGRQQLQNFFNTHFDDEGKQISFLTGYPETLWILEFRGEMVGYHHFFVDNWDDGKNHFIASVLDPHLSYADRIII